MPKHKEQSQYMELSGVLSGQAAVVQQLELNIAELKTRQETLDVEAARHYALFVETTASAQRVTQELHSQRSLHNTLRGTLENFHA